MKRKTHDTEAQWGNYTELRNRKDQMKLRQTVTDVRLCTRLACGPPLACFNMLFVLAALDSGC